MLSVQSRLREIAAARVRVYAGLPFEHDPLPEKNIAVIQLRMGRTEKDSLPAYLLADAFLQLPPDTEVRNLELCDYGTTIAVVVASRDFPVRDSTRFDVPYIYPEVDTEYIENGNQAVRRIRSIKFGEAI